MGTPYFNRDESIILTAHRVSFESSLSDAMLTSERLILIDAGYAQFKPRTIPLSIIETAIAGEDAQGNPIITLSLAPERPGGASQAKDLVFHQKTAGERKQECLDWVRHLKEQILIARTAASATTVPAAEQTDIVFEGPGITPSIPPDTPTQSIPPPGEGEPLQHGHAATPDEHASPEAGCPVSTPTPETHSAHRTRLSAGIIAMIIVVIMAGIGGVYLYSTALHGPAVAPPATTPTPLPTSAPLATPTTAPPVPSPTPAISPPPATPSPLPVPRTGVWVHVQYAGNFSGMVGVSGGLQQRSGSGERFFQVPAIEGIVSATFEKQDGSANPLVVEIYQNGLLLTNGTVTAPKGTVDIRTELRAP